MGEEGIRCTSLCKSNRQIGAPRSIPAEWLDNNNWKQAGFYKKELTIASERRRHNHLIERLDEFGEGFEQWHFLNDTDLGHVIEFGAGGYTQTRNILERTHGITLSSVTLIDPLIHFYQKIKSCSFESGKLAFAGRVFENTTLIESTVEAWGKAHTGLTYDTVICMNVLVYAKDAFRFLETLLAALKPGGLLLFHDRWFDDPSISSGCKMSGFMTNVLQVRKPLLDHFLTFLDFQLPKTFLSTKQTSRQAFRSKSWCPNRDNERGFWAAGRRRTL
jgi:SAM-dependent methyltransferase